MYKHLTHNIFLDYTVKNVLRLGCIVFVCVIAFIKKSIVAYYGISQVYFFIYCKCLFSTHFSFLFLVFHQSFPHRQGYEKVIKGKSSWSDALTWGVSSENLTLCLYFCIGMDANHIYYEILQHLDIRNLPPFKGRLFQFFYLYAFCQASLW